MNGEAKREMTLRELVDDTRKRIEELESRVEGHLQRIARLEREVMHETRPEFPPRA